MALQELIYITLRVRNGRWASPYIPMSLLEDEARDIAKDWPFKIGRYFLGELIDFVEKRIAPFENECQHWAAALDAIYLPREV